jgi:hypothetical protein
VNAFDAVSAGLLGTFGLSILMAGSHVSLARRRQARLARVLDRPGARAAQRVMARAEPELSGLAEPAAEPVSEAAIPAAPPPPPAAHPALDLAALPDSPRYERVAPQEPLLPEPPAPPAPLPLEARAAPPPAAPAFDRAEPADLAGEASDGAADGDGQWPLAWDAVPEPAAVDLPPPPAAPPTPASPLRPPWIEEREAEEARPGMLDATAAAGQGGDHPAPADDLVAYMGAPDSARALSAPEPVALPGSPPPLPPAPDMPPVDLPVLQFNFTGVNVTEPPAVEEAPSPAAPSGPVLYHLVVEEGPDSGLRAPLHAGQSLTVGRSSGADLALSDPGVSRLHCRITSTEQRGRVVVEDLGSLNGTQVNDLPAYNLRLGVGDHVRVGSTVIRLEEHFEVGGA